MKNRKKINLYLLFSRTFGWIPERLLAGTGRFFVSRIFKLDKKLSDITDAQILFAEPLLRKNPEYANLSQEQIITTLKEKIFSHVGQMFAELAKLPALAKHSLPATSSSFAYVSHQGPSPFDPSIYPDATAGGIVLSGHLGMFELLAAYHCHYVKRVCVVGRNPDSSLLGRFLDDLRSYSGLTAIWRNDMHSTRKLVKAVKNNNYIAALVDQDTALESGFAKFFGLEAAYPVTLLKLALKNDARVFTSFIIRKSNNHHEVISEEIFYKGQADPVQFILDTLSQRLEDLVIKYPEQWVWWHRRWRRRPGVNYEQNPELLIKTTDYIKWISEQRISEQRQVNA